MFCFGVFFLSNLAAGGKDFICCSGEKKKKKRRGGKGATAPAAGTEPSLHFGARAGWAGSCRGDAAPSDDSSANRGWGRHRLERYFGRVGRWVRCPPHPASMLLLGLGVLAHPGHRVGCL